MKKLIISCILIVLCSCTSSQGTDTAGTGQLTGVYYRDSHDRDYILTMDREALCVCGGIDLSDFSDGDFIRISNTKPDRWGKAKSHYNIEKLPEAYSGYDPDTTAEMIEGLREINIDLTHWHFHLADGNIQYIRTGGADLNAESKQIFVINDYNELTDQKIFAGDDRKKYYMDQINKYDSGWFENNKLIMVILQETSSGSIRHIVTDISDSAIIVERVIPDVITDDDAEWCIFIELDKDYPITDNAYPDIVINDLKLHEFQLEYLDYTGQ